jgi:hypothetical protein
LSGKDVATVAAESTVPDESDAAVVVATDESVGKNAP